MSNENGFYLFATIVALLIINVSTEDIPESGAVNETESSNSTVADNNATEIDGESLKKFMPEKPLTEELRIDLSKIEEGLYDGEYGEYSTISYSYHNDRYLGWQTDEPKGYICHDNYIKCLLSQTVRTPVCAVHRIRSWTRGIRNLPSICDMFHYNCRRGFRYFFVMKYGLCTYEQRGRLHAYSPIN